MMVLMTFKLPRRLTLAAFLGFALILGVSGLAAQTRQTIEALYLRENPSGMQIQLSGKAPFKVVKTDAYEIMVAFKGAELSENLDTGGTAGTLIRRIRVQRLPNDVEALIINTTRDVGSVNSEWVENGNILWVGFNTRQMPTELLARQKAAAKSAGGVVVKRSSKKAVSGPKVAAAPSAKAVSEPAPEPKPALAAAEPVETVAASARSADEAEVQPATPVVQAKNLFNLIGESDCGRQGEIDAALKYAQNRMWQDALYTLETFVKDRPDSDCIDAAYHLLTHCFFKARPADDAPHQLKSVRAFQDALNYFPDSTYTPYTLAGLAKAYQNLSNDPEANGFYDLVLKKYPDYPGVPEVLYEKGRIAVDGNRLAEADEIFKKVMTDHPNSLYAAESRFELGKLAYQQKNFSDALRYFENVVAANPEKKYQSEELLQYMGQCYYQAEQYEKARDALTQALNYFPDSKANHAVLTRIGDTYADQNQPEKAKQIYELVIDRYPGTDGFVVSAIQRAKLLNDLDQQKDTYQMVISDYPDHPMARFAMLRLAMAQNQNSEYDDSIDTVRALEKRYARSFRVESEALLKDSYHALLAKYSANGDYARVLARYEAEKAAIDQFNDPRIDLIIAKSYEKGHLYPEATAIYKKAYNEFPSGKRPGSLILGLAVSLQESGNPGEAMKYLDAYIRFFPMEPGIPKAYIRKGEILQARKDYDGAIANYQTAFKKDTAGDIKAEALMREAEAQRALGKDKLAESRLKQAIDLLTPAAGDKAEPLFIAWRKLGDTYLDLNSYLQAAYAYSNAMSHSRRSADAEDLRIAMADAYKKGNKPEKATEVYKEIMASGDEFWGKLAEEKLRGLELEEKLRKS